MNEDQGLVKIYEMTRSIGYFMLAVEFLLYVPIPGFDEMMLYSFLIGFFSRLGIYSNLIYSRGAILFVVAFSCLGTRARKDMEFDMHRKITIPLLTGLALTALSIWVYLLDTEGTVWRIRLSHSIYIVLSIAGTLTIHVALDSITKAIKGGLMKDRMNWENESWEQETRKLADKDAINIPMKFYYKNRMNDGWINIEQPFRGIWVVGVPGSGKTFSIIEPLIRQEAAKGWSMCVYDFKYPVLARKLFYQFEKQKILGVLPKHSTFNVINFVNVEYSRRVNPIQLRYINSLGEALETANTLIEALGKGKGGGGGSDQFFKKSAENFLAACLYYFANTDIQPYDKDWNLLTEHKKDDGKVYYTDDKGNEAELFRKKGRYSDLPHVLAFMQESYTTIFDVLMQDDRIAPLVSPFRTAYENQAMDQLEGMIGTLRVDISRLVSEESFWVLSGDDFDLKISDPKNPSYLLIANDPKMESVITALNAVILNRLVVEVNSGEGKNNPVGIIVDELPTLYFNKIDRLQGTARSNKVSVALGFQSKEQLEKDYSKEVAGTLLNIFGTVVCAASCGKDTVEWLSNDIMGKIKQVKKSFNVNRQDVTFNLNEEMLPMLPPEKIANMPAGWLCGMTARSFRELKEGFHGKVDTEKDEEFQHSKFYCKTNFDMALIKAEEERYVEIPKFYDFGNEEHKKEILSNNYQRIINEVKMLCKAKLGDGYE